MQPYYWNNWYSTGGWFLWFGVLFLFFSALGNWGYTYRVHRKVDDPQKDALDILNERYARGDIKRDEYVEMRTHILLSRDVIGKSEMRKKSNQQPLFTPASGH